MNTIGCLELYYNSFIILFTQIIHESKQNILYFIVPYIEKYSAVPATSLLLLCLLPDLLGLR